LRASLITLVATKNIGVVPSFGPAREILVSPHIRHGGQQVGQLAAGQAQQRRRQDGAVLRFGAAAMLSGPLFQGSHHGLFHASHQ
jgi:hypothetical protein